MCLQRGPLRKSVTQRGSANKQILGLDDNPFIFSLYEQREHHLPFCTDGILSTPSMGIRNLFSALSADTRTLLETLGKRISTGQKMTAFPYSPSEQDVSLVSGQEKNVISQQIFRISASMKVLIYSPCISTKAEHH